MRARTTATALVAGAAALAGCLQMGASSPWEAGPIAASWTPDPLADGDVRVLWVTGQTEHAGRSLACDWARWFEVDPRNHTLGFDPQAADPAAWAGGTLVAVEVLDGSCPAAVQLAANSSAIVSLVFHEIVLQPGVVPPPALHVDPATSRVGIAGPDGSPTAPLGELGQGGGALRVTYEEAGTRSMVTVHDLGGWPPSAFQPWDVADRAPR